MRCLVVLTLLASLALNHPTTSTETPPHDPERLEALLNDKRLVHIMDVPEQPEATLDQWWQTIEEAVIRHEGTLDPGERNTLIADHWNRSVRKAWAKKVVVPSITVTAEDVEREYQAARGSLDRAPGVKVLEIFLWAPRSRPELRAERLALAREIHAMADSAAAFSEAAIRHSDATSYFRGGSIGTVHSNQITKDLEAVLFTGRPGPTEIVETADGIYLFFVAAVVPARVHDPAQVRRRIQRGLRTQKARAAFDAKLAMLRTQASHGGARGQARIDLRQVAPTLEFHGVSDATIRDVGVSALMASELIATGAPVPQPRSPEAVLAIYHRIVDLWVEALAAEPNSPATGVNDAVKRQSSTVDVWTFSVLWVRPVADRSAWLSVVEAANDATGSSDVLQQIQQTLRASHDLHSEIDSFAAVTLREVAHLGPEIHTSIRRHLEPGDVSRVLHLADRDTAAVIHLADHSLRTVASSADIGAVPSRTRTQLQEAIIRRMLTRKDCTAPKRVGDRKKPGALDAPGSE
jgi:hypothetical protein